MEREKLEQQERIEIEKEKLQFELKMKELELEGKSKSKPLPLGSGKSFDVTKHIRLVPPFQEKEVDKYFLHFEKVAENLKLPREHHTFAERCNRKSSRNLHSAFTRTKLRL